MEEKKECCCHHKTKERSDKEYKDLIKKLKEESSEKFTKRRFL